MMYLVLTAEGLESIRGEFSAHGDKVWINPDIVSDDDLDALRAGEIGVEVLDPALDPGRQKELLVVIESIERRFPDDELMVEFV